MLVRYALWVCRLPRTLDAPLTPRAVVVTASHAGVPAPAPANVLVVDDVEDNLLTTQSLLVRRGLTVLIASSAAGALELLSQHEVALAHLDVQMPQVNGFELAERMRRNDRTRNVPIIFMTGYASDPSRTFFGYEAGAVDFLFKPLDPRVLQSKVAVFCGTVPAAPRALRAQRRA